MQTVKIWTDSLTHTRPSLKRMALLMRQPEEKQTPLFLFFKWKIANLFRVRFPSLSSLAELAVCAWCPSERIDSIGPTHPALVLSHLPQLVDMFSLAKFLINLTDVSSSCATRIRVANGRDTAESRQESNNFLANETFKM